MPCDSLRENENSKEYSDILGENKFQIPRT